MALFLLLVGFYFVHIFTGIISQVFLFTKVGQRKEVLLASPLRNKLLKLLYLEKFHLSILPILVGHWIVYKIERMPSLSCDTDFHQYKSVFWGESGYDFCPVLLFDRRKCLSVLVFKGRKHQDYLIWPCSFHLLALQASELHIFYLDKYSCLED